MFNFLSSIFGGHKVWLSCKKISVKGCLQSRTYTVYICPKCRKETIIATKYCGNCGKRLHKM